MKKNCYLMIIFLSLLGCERPTGRVHLIFLFDNVNKELCNDFTQTLEPYSRRRANFEELTVTVYQAAMTDNMQPAMATFKYAESNHDHRKMQYNNFADPLNKMVSNEYQERYLLHLINNIYNQINDTTVNYQIYIASALSENSTGANDLSADNNNQVNGHYQFVNEDGEVNNLEIRQAQKHLTDSASWVFRHLVQIHQENPLLSKCHITTTIYKQPQMANGSQRHSSKSGADDIDIKKYWKELFAKIDPNYKWKEATFSVDVLREVIKKGG